MSNIGYKTGDLSAGKLVTSLEKEISELKAKVADIMRRLEAIGG